MMAALQVQEALKILHGLPVEAGSAMVFNGVANQFYTTRLPRRDDCLSHETYPAPAELPLGHGATAAALFAEARGHRGTALGGPLSLALERDLVVAFDCPRCGWRAEVLRPRTKVAMSEAVCPHCREPARPEVVSAVEEHAPLADLPLVKLGVPPYDIVRVEGDGDVGSGFFLLAADRAGRDAGWPSGGLRG
jgi:adenylyltransferase/sulfurtransferase